MKIITWSPKYLNIKLSNNKYLSIQLEFNNFVEDNFKFSLEFARQTDHAGWEFIFSICKLFWFNVHFYDRRHWDHNENKWQEPEDCKMGKWEFPKTR